MNLNKQFPTFKKMYKSVYNINYSKAILSYCFRVAIFLILNRSFFLNLMFPMYNFLFASFCKNYEEGLFYNIGTFAILSFICHSYIFAKLCGLFKKINHLNIFIALVVMILIEILRCFSWAIIVQSPTKISFIKPEFIFVLPFVFLIYKFFNFILIEIVSFSFL